MLRLKGLRLIAAGALIAAAAYGARYLLGDTQSDERLPEDFDDSLDDDFEDFEDDPQDDPAPVAD